MIKNAADHIKPLFQATGIIYKVFGILLTMTLISMWLVCGMLAKYTSNVFYNDSAHVARMATVKLHEHKVNLEGGVYFLDNDTIVETNEYDTVLPGVNIPKDAYIQLDGNSEVACNLYIEVVNTNLPDEVSYTIGTSFEAETSFTPLHGGIVYKYKQVIQPGVAQTIAHIFSNDSIRVGDSLRDNTDKTKNAGQFKIEVYAYLVQID
ncbi:hypothetical protein [uncultured Ruminococcus sp.]|uniref:hypothetical protein n=1 Tax=uncultured Ruminococcus sp. TaxID=165186 RepID=UPI0025DAC154|nr:hypothetical protein [uncultured Ruminococcus sp.]